MTVPVEVWQLIALHIDHPNPAMLTRLSGISRNAYAVFTCDALWRPISPLHLGKNYFLEYLSRVGCLSIPQRKLMVRAWDAVSERYDQRGGSAALYLRNSADNLYFREMLDVANSDPDVTLPIAIWYGLNPMHCQNLGLSLLSVREFVVLAVQMEGRVLAQCPCFCDDDVIVASALRRRGEMLEIVSPRLMMSREMVLLAASSFGSALRFADSQFAADREIALAAVGSHGWSLQRVSTDLQGDEEIVSTAIQSYAAALKLAAQHIQNNKAIVLAAVKRQGWVLQYASTALQDDAQVVAAAYENCSSSVEYASPRLMQQYKTGFTPSNPYGSSGDYWARHASWVASSWVRQASV